MNFGVAFLLFISAALMLSFAVENGVKSKVEQAAQYITIGVGFLDLMTAIVLIVLEVIPRLN